MVKSLTALLLLSLTIFIHLYAVLGLSISRLRVSHESDMPKSLSKRSVDSTKGTMSGYKMVHKRSPQGYLQRPSANKTDSTASNEAGDTGSSSNRLPVSLPEDDTAAFILPDFDCLNKQFYDARCWTVLRMNDWLTSWVGSFDLSWLRTFGLVYWIRT